MAEQTSRLADIEALTDGVRWRWGMICVGAVLLQMARSVGLSELTPWLIVIFVAVGVIANLTLLRLLQINSHRWWLTYSYCLIDVLLLSIAIVYLGPGGTVAGFFLVIIPCALRPNRTVALFALSAASVGYLIAASVHGLLSGRPEGGTLSLPTSVILDLVLFVAVASTLMATLTKLFGRIANIHSVIDSAADGSIKPGTLDNRNDLLGQFGRSLQTMLEDVASTIEMVQTEAAEVATLAELFAQFSRKADESRRQVASMATGLAQDLGDLQAISKAAHTESTAVAQEALNLQSRAENDERDALAFEETVQRGRDRVVRTSETVLAIGADINRTTSIVDELGGLSRQIGSSALSIAKVARHTHVLALNAAIEAARAEEHGKEFAVVADQVRTLAGEAGRSARDVGNLIGDVQAGILAAENALLAGKEKVNNVGVTVGEARAALNDLRSGASNAADLVSTTVETSQTQAKIAGSLASKMSQLIENSTRWSVDVAETAKTMSAQTMALNDLSQASQRLAELAERLKVQVARHSTQERSG